MCRVYDACVFVWLLSVIKKIRKAVFLSLFFPSSPALPVSINWSCLLGDAGGQLYAFHQCCQHWPTQHTQAGLECISVSTLVKLVYRRCILTAKPKNTAVHPKFFFFCYALDEGSTVICIQGRSYPSHPLPISQFSYMLGYLHLIAHLS